AFKPGDIALWDPLPFTTVEDQLHRWRDTALGAVRAATSAGAASGDSLQSLADRLIALQRAWESDATIESHAETFRQLGLSVPVRAPKHGEEALRPVRSALTYLAQFRERGLPRPLIEWLASGDPRARVAALQQHVAAVTRTIESASAAERTFAAAGAVDTTVWYGEWPKGATFAHREGRFHRAIEASGSLARYATRLRARANVLAGPIPAACELLE